MSNGHTLTRRQRISFREWLFGRQVDCHWCGKPMHFGGLLGKPDMATLEHLNPLSKGGDDHPDNLVLAHDRCNK